MKRIYLIALISALVAGIATYMFAQSVISNNDPNKDKTEIVYAISDVPAGTQVRLTPGESISIYPYMYHDFEVEEGSGPVLLGEVSQCNDDNVDNRFYEKMGRFPKIEEDEAPYRLLCNEYPEAK